MTDIEIGGDFVDVGTPEITKAFFAPGATARFNINSVEVTSVISAKVVRTNGYECANLELILPTGVVTTLAPYQRVEYWDKLSDGTAYKQFDGYIDRIEPDGRRTRVFAYDKLHKAVELNATNKTYDASVDAEAGVISAIFKDLLDQAGLTYNSGSTTIQLTSAYSLPTVDKFVCDENDIFEQLVRLASMVNWQFYYKPNDDNVYFEPKGYQAASTPLVVGTNIISVPRWTENITELVNVLTVKGCVNTFQKTELFSGDGVTTTFNLAEEPYDLKVQTPIGTVKVGGVPNSTTGYDYYLNDFINADGTHVPQIVFGTAPAAGASNIQVDYSFDVPTPVTINGPQASRDAYGSREKTITFTDTLTVADGGKFADSYVRAFCNPFLNVACDVMNGMAEYYVGQSVVVTDGTPNGYSNETLVINRQTINYPSIADAIVAGQRDWVLSELDTTTQKRLARLEAQFAGPTTATYVTQIVGSDLRMIRTELKIVEWNPNDWFVYDNAMAYDAGYKYDNQSTVTSTTTYTY